VFVFVLSFMERKVFEVEQMQEMESFGWLVGCAIMKLGFEWILVQGLELNFLIRLALLVMVEV
jgi:hypothetical protein